MRRDFIDRLPLGLGRLRHMNLTLLLCVIALMAIGVCFIYSANSIRDSVKLQSQYIGHAKTAVAGIFVVLAMAYIDYRHILRWSWLIYLVSLLLLVAVLLFGDTRMGATRWVFGFQPSELAKLALILVLAQMLGRPEARQDIWEFLLALLLAAVLVALILMQPDLGTALVFGPVLLLMLFAAGTAPRVWFGTVAAGLLAVALVVGAITLQESPGTPAGLRRAARQATFFLGDYQRDRIVDVLYPDRDPLNRGWNRRQSQIAIGSGGLWGKGFLKGDQNLLGYLPQQVSANDFIFSVLAEETGYAGALCVLLLYAGGIVSGHGCRSPVLLPCVHQHRDDHRAAAGYRIAVAVYQLRQNFYVDGHCGHGPATERGGPCAPGARAGGHLLMRSPDEGNGVEHA